MEIKAQLKFLRIAPRKVRAVLDIVRGSSIEEAEAKLSLLPKKSSTPVLKLLRSALANALNNYPLKKEDLTIKTIQADEGPTIKRWMPKAFGRATPIHKKSSHVTIILESKKEVVAKHLEQKEEIKVESAEEAKEKKSGNKKEELKKGDEPVKKNKGKKGFGKKIFSRKAI